MPHPLVAVVPSPFVKGVNSLADNAAHLPLVEFETALNTDWPTDVHLLTYVVADATGEVQSAPRINKPCLPLIQAKGWNVYVTMIVIDIDAPGHMPLTEATHKTLDSQIINALTIDPTGLLQQFTAYYTTRGGMRFIYELTNPIPANEAEDYIRGLISLFQQAGIDINEKECTDWTRLFRLPHATRDGTLLGHRLFDELLLSAKTIDCANLPRIPATDKERSPYADALDEDMPTAEVYSLYCEELSDKGAMVFTKQYKRAKMLLKGRNCFPCLFEDAPLGQQGNRDNHIQQFVGEACALLVNEPKSSADFIMALFYPAGFRLNEAETNPAAEDWCHVIWRAICKYWPREVAKTNAKEIDTEDAWGRVINGMRVWDSSSILHSDDDLAAVKAYVVRRGVLSCRQSYYILNRDGHYDTEPIDKHHIIAKIRELGMDGVLQTWSPTNRGVEDRSIQGMLNANVATGFEVKGIVTEEGDGTIKDNKLIRTLFRRKAIEPKFNKDVDAWLRMFAGLQYPKLLEWIGLSLAWDEGPICALSIKGPPGCGKKLLVQGLSEAVNKEEASTTIEFSKFKSGIKNSPFLVINEGFPSKGSMEMEPCDTFRAFVGGDKQRIQEKYQVPIEVFNPIRVIITTNNDDIIRSLAGGRDLSPFDRDAIAQRLFHIDVETNVVEWLLQMGGLNFTRGWIAGDGGAPSKYVLASHFLWLYEARPRNSTLGHRLLMEGSNNERIVKAMTLRSGSAPAVFEALALMIDRSGRGEGCAIVESNGKIFVTENMIEKFEEREWSGRRKTNHHVIKAVLGAMRMPGTQPVEAVKGEKRGERLLAMWHQLNGPLIMEEAIERGLPTARLQYILGLTDVDPAIREPRGFGVDIKSVMVKKGTTT